MPNTTFSLNTLIKESYKEPSFGEEFYISELRIGNVVNEFPTIVGLSSNVLRSHSQYTTTTGADQSEDTRSIQLLTSTPRYAFIIKPKTSTNEEFFIVPPNGQYAEHYIKAVGFIETEADLLVGLNIGTMPMVPNLGDLESKRPGVTHIRGLDNPSSTVAFLSDACRGGDGGEGTLVILEAQKGIVDHTFLEFLKTSRGIQYRNEPLFAFYGLDVNNHNYVVLSAASLNKKMGIFYRHVVGLVKPHKMDVVLRSENERNEGTTCFYMPPMPVTLGDISISVADATKSGLWTWKSASLPPSSDTTVYNLNMDITIIGFKKKHIPAGITIYPRHVAPQVSPPLGGSLNYHQ
jgi:hypothetical protein